MEAITEGVSNIIIGDPQKNNRIQVSNTKKPLFFYVNLAKVFSTSPYTFFLRLIYILLFPGSTIRICTYWVQINQD